MEFTNIVFAIFGTFILGGLALGSYQAVTLMFAFFHNLQQTLALAQDLLKETRLEREAHRNTKPAATPSTTPYVSLEFRRLGEKISDLEAENIRMRSEFNGRMNDLDKNGPTRTTAAPETVNPTHSDNHQPPRVHEDLVRQKQQLDEPSQLVDTFQNDVKAHMNDMNAKVEILQRKLNAHKVPKEMLQRLENTEKSVNSALKQCQELQRLENTEKSINSALKQCQEQLEGLRMAAEGAQKLAEDKTESIMGRVERLNKEMSRATSGLRSVIGTSVSLTERIDKLEGQVNNINISQLQHDGRSPDRPGEDVHNAEEDKLTRLQAELSTYDAKLEKVKSIVSDAFDDLKANTAANINEKTADINGKLDELHHQAQVQRDENLALSNSTSEYIRKVESDATTKIDQAIENLEESCRETFGIVSSQCKSFSDTIMSDLQVLRQEHESLNASHSQLLSNLAQPLPQDCIEPNISNTVSDWSTPAVMGQGASAPSFCLQTPIADPIFTAPTGQAAAGEGQAAASFGLQTHNAGPIFTAPTGQAAQEQNAVPATFEHVFAGPIFTAFTGKAAEEQNAVPATFGQVFAGPDTPLPTYPEQGTGGQAAPPSMFSFGIDNSHLSATASSGQVPAEDATLGKADSGDRPKKVMQGNPKKSEESRLMEDQPLTHYSSLFLNNLRLHMASRKVLASLVQGSREDAGWISSVKNTESTMHEKAFCGLSKDTESAVAPYTGQMLYHMITGFFDTEVWTRIQGPDDDDAMTQLGEEMREHYVNIFEMFMKENGADSYSSSLLAEQAALVDEEDTSVYLR